MKTEPSHAAMPPPQPPTLREVTDLLQVVEPDGKESGFDLLNRELEDLAQEMSDLGIETDSDECEEDDDDDDDATVLTEDESHYITTHAIRLSELSDGHDGDSDPGAGSSSSSTWDVEDGHQVFSFFVDYASFESNGVLMMTRGGGAAGGGLRESDPSLPFGARGEDGGRVQMSIKTTSQAINDPIQENTVYHAKDARDTCPSAAGGVDGNVQELRDRAKVVIPAPGGKLQAQESPEYSSCASSELDDTDKEVRNLTARAFKSLAYPYLDAINFSTSSESSTSEHGINRWSTFVDLKYSNVSQSLVSQPTAELERVKNSSDFSQQLNGDAAPHSASSTKKIELMGKFGQGVIRLTETLNFRCNVKSGMSAGERRASVAPKPTGAGSHSMDEVTVNSLPGGRGRGATAQSKSMEGTHKKAIFASSVIQNVLSKKMQFEQERRMERGEVEETHHKGDCRRSKALQRQSSKLSESNSDSADDLADIVACGSRRDSRVQETRSEAPGKATDAKRGAMEVSKGPLLRSQNSAFRCWRNEELEFPQDHKNHKTPEETAPPQGMGEEFSASGGKLTKMSHLFVPNIQRVANGGEVQKELQLGSDHTLYIADSKGVAASKSPEIQIHLQSCNAASLTKTDDSKGKEARAASLRGDSSDKPPHFMVRGIRDGKGKLQTPIHQVRDVRKLVKSSYHFVSLDPKSNFATADSHQDCQHPTSASPIVIKCQSVNTNSSKCGLPQDASSPEGAQSSAMQRAAGGAPQGILDHLPEEMSSGIESKLLSKKDVTEKQPMSNQVALEKLQAAVKTMEQLYVFDKNEWKRKNETQPLMDSHVLSLIASEENSEEEALRGSVVEEIARRDSYPRLNKTPAAENWLRTGGDHDERLKARLAAAPVGFSVGVAAKTLQPNNAASASYNSKTFAPKSPKLPMPLKVFQPKTSGESKEILAAEQNYLTIPVKSHANSGKEGLSAFSSQSRPTSLPLHIHAQGSKGQEEQAQRSSGAATIYHSVPLGMSANQPQVYCFSPAIPPPPVLDPYQATQRKMLLDPTSGSYYLVDTPAQPSTRRLFDPETGHYVEVPVPLPPVTPVPMPISPMALGSAAYGHTYMIYPGFVTSPPVISTRTLVQPQVLVESSEKALPHQSEGMYMETPFYMTTGKAAPGTPNVVSIARPHQGFPSGEQPVIGVTSQQGPRIIAPPSFDGTTVSFVVEHR
ncbi:uncharacterized protein C4orf54 homolog [Phyllopteryx taeniolatus]|uniref:uncharacterized protein C4orf54 homolog n=1 Tax=Phyllopteryx taeniolatus TaxID=161469 RepID=UPI002AD35DC8|nr:uncharacterized protein C4orf54 homolog [Phyllopteryx taeniolatus]XP_061620437.1 uncharacterized protein C4orf54 homolog [Phyllopteryx taeniolatus]XP_061620438.1 uncharacterized protein C4orf54 homolog [Phyllopteryx taeniolatus]XP_061620442.1 uncharacterized protein C4orf54 homolog [Phyllopteryx taeniolatus]